MINIDILLSTESIEAALIELQTIKDILEIKTNETVEIIAREAEDVANSAYGNMVSAESEAHGNEAIVYVSGGDKAIIAEFGAGYATMEEHPFAGAAPVPVHVGSYSEEHVGDMHGGMFFLTDSMNPGGGFWEFGGTKMSRVEPRHGLLDAYTYIVENAVQVAQEVIRFD